MRSEMTFRPVPQVVSMDESTSSNGAQRGESGLTALFRAYPFLTTGLFISPSGISELDCATTKTDTAERSISIGRESLQVFLY